MDYVEPVTPFQYVKEKSMTPKPKKITKELFATLWSISLANDPCEELILWIIKSMESAAREGTLHYDFEISKPIKVSNPAALIKRLTSYIDVNGISITIINDQINVKIV